MLSHILYCNDSLLIPLVVVLRQVPLAVALQIYFIIRLSPLHNFISFKHGSGD